MRNDPTAPGRSPLSGMTCLIVDDDPTFCEIAAATIRRESGRPVVRTGGIEALQYLETHHCDLAIVDVIMPKIDGFRLISLIRYMPKCEQLPIAVVTSRLDHAAKDEATRMGVNCFMTKPVNWFDFAKKLGEMLPDSGKRTNACDKMPGSECRGDHEIST